MSNMRNADRQTSEESLIAVSIVEDDGEIRESLALLIGEAEGFLCSGTYPDCETAVPAICSERPDAVLMDIGLPGMSGIDGARKIRESLPSINIIMLTIHKDDDLVFRSLCAGASGYLVKNTPPKHILEAIREAVDGGAPMSSSIARMIVESFRSSGNSPLTAREIDVLSQLCKGQSYKMIGDTLFISEQTVHFHIKNIYQKLHVHSKSEAVAKAIRERLV